MGNGEWGMGNGEWGMGNGKWEIGNGKMGTENLKTENLILEGKENRGRLQTLSINNAWCNKNVLYYLTFLMLQHTSSDVNGYICYTFKIQK